MSKHSRIATPAPNTTTCRAASSWRARTAAAAVLASPAWLPQVAYAQTEDTSRDVIVSIFLRGGADGLSLVVPYAENAYYTLRPTIAIPRPDSTSANKAVDLNGFFGLPPAMASLLPAYQAGQLLVVHATGSTDPTRSHFDAQAFMEIGVPGARDIETGWLGRHLASKPPMKPNAALRGAGVQLRPAADAGRRLPTRCRFPTRRTSGSSGTLVDARGAAGLARRRRSPASSIRSRRPR